MSQLLGSGLLMQFDGAEQNLDIHSSLPRQYSCLDGGISPQSLSMRFMTSCTTSEPEAHAYQKGVSPQSVRYPESSQRTTSAFPSSSQYDLRVGNFDYFTPPTLLSPMVPPNGPRAYHMHPNGRGWVGGQDVEQGTPAHLDIQTPNYSDSQSPSRLTQASPDSSSTEYTFSDDSDMETGRVMSKMMDHFQVHTPPLDVESSAQIAEQELPTSSIMTFRLGRRSLRPVTDPDSARILENFDDADEGTSESSCESLSPSSPPFYSPGSFSGGKAAGSCGGRAMIGVASPIERCSSYTPDEIPFRGSDGNIHPLTPRNPKPRTGRSSKKSKMHQCEICHKNFPRPSGLNTHMNSHSGAKRAS
jgi:hypothetical protein